MISSDSIVQRRGVRQFIKFGLVGLSSTAIDWSIFYLLNLTFGVYYLYAKVFSFAIAVINSFIWNRRWTFRSQDPNQMRQFSKFLTIALIGLGLNTLIMYIVVTVLNQQPIAGLVAASAIVVFWDFLANKFYTFKESKA